MRLQLILLLLTIAPAMGAASAELDSSSYSLDAMTGVRLVYVGELIDSARQPFGRRYNRWSTMLPRSIHAVAAGDQTVFALALPDCHSYPGPYLPSHCGDGQVAVFALLRTPEVSEVVELGGEHYIASAVFLGDLLGPRRSGCLAFPKRVRIERVHSGASARGIILAIEAEFEAESHSSGESCGFVSVAGRFYFDLKRLEDLTDGGVRYLFGCDGDVKFAALCARSEASRDGAIRELGVAR